MALNISKFNPNFITAVIDDPLDDLTLCRHVILGYEVFLEVPQLVVYGGIRLNGDCLEIDIKDDETEEFFKSLVQCLLRISGYCSVLPLINYGSCYLLVVTPVRLTYRRSLMAALRMILIPHACPHFL